MKFFWTVWCVDILVLAVVFYFFVIGIFDGTVSSKNFVMWISILVPIAGVVAGSYLLKSHGEITWAKTLAALLAIPGILSGIFALYLSNQKWQ